MKSSTICQDWLESLPPTEGYLKKEQSIGREFLLKQRNAPLRKMKRGDYPTSIN